MHVRLTYLYNKTWRMINLDEPVKSQEFVFIVIPAEAGIQSFQ